MRIQQAAAFNDSGSMRFPRSNVPRGMIIDKIKHLQKQKQSPSGSYKHTTQASEHGVLSSTVPLTSYMNA